jgi:hypothetical protein
MVKTRSSVGKPVSSSSKSSAVFSSSYPDRTVKKHGGKMEVRLQSSDGTTRSVQVQAMEPLLLSAASAAASSDDLRRYTPAAVAASLPPPGCYPPGGAGIIQREKRIGEPVTARDYLNPRKRARSTSPPPPPAAAGRPMSEQGAVGGSGESADRMWVAAAAGGSRTQAASGGEKIPKGGASGGAGLPVGYLGDEEGGEESGDSEEEEEEEEEELPPGDRVAYIHVGEGGEADLEAQLKGEISNPVFRIRISIRSVDPYPNLDAGGQNYTQK